MKYLSLTEDKYLTDKANSFMVLDLTAHDLDSAIVYYNLSYSDAKRAKQVLIDLMYKNYNTNEKTQSVKELYIVCHRDDRLAIAEELFYNSLEGWEVSSNN